MANVGILWDVDGTLLDSADQHRRAWERLAAEIGRPFTGDDFARTFGWRNPEIIRTLFESDATDERCAQLAEVKETHYRAAVAAEGVRLLPGAAGLLEAFADRGWKQAVGSSAPRRNLDLLLAATDTARYFAAVVCGDDVTRGKPDPEVFLTAAAKIGVPPGRCLVLEDATAGVRAAKAAGMRCAAVTFVAHHPADALRAAGADVVVGSLADLTADAAAGLLAAASPSTPRRSPG